MTENLDTHPNLDQARRRGVFVLGDRVQLTDSKGRKNTIILQEKGYFQSHRGGFRHSELLGKPEGSVIETDNGRAFLALRPLLSDYVLSMPRGAAVIYPKDAGQIVQMADIFPGAFVVEAGLGSGGLTMSLLRAVGLHGRLLSVERRPDFAEIACANVDLWFGARHPAWEIQIGDLASALESLPAGSVDRVILDMLAPWENLQAASHALAPGGVLLAYVATTTQLSRLAEEIKFTECFSEPLAWESLIREWHLQGLAVRPEHRMIGHSGFLLTARRLAPGVTSPMQSRRPAKGAYNYDEDWEADDFGIQIKSARRVRRVHRDVTARAAGLDSAEEGSEENS